MKEVQKDLLKSILGDDIFDVLKKYEIYKPNTKTVVDPEEVKVALQIVPRTVLSYLFAHLKHREIEAVINLELPFAPGRMLINKQGTDNYKGEVTSLDGKKLVEFKNRSLPSIGLILLTTFELYDLSLLDEIKEDKENKENKEENKLDKLQEIIDERLKLRSLICEVVDQRISQKDAIERMIRERLNNHIVQNNYQEEEEEGYDEEEVMEENSTKKSRLKEFLEGRENKKLETIEIVDKSEINCPDCRDTLYKGEKDIKLCICYGEHWKKNIKIKKNEDGRFILKFPKNFDVENVEMLLDAIKNK